MNKKYITELNGYKIKDDETIRSFNNIADMKADTKLKEGYHIKTKGYYEIDDGGAGEYIIINDGNLIDDGGSIIDLNNGLKAKLINDSVNVKQFGAYGDNTHDDTDYFKNAIAFLNENNTLYIPIGEYLISDTLEIKDTLSLKGLNGVPYLIYTSTGSLIEIKGHSIDENNYDEGSLNSKAEKKPILSQLVLTTNTENYYGKESTIGIEFASEENKTIARSFIRDVRINHFNIGIKFAVLNFYIMTFDNLSLSRNNTGVLIPNVENQNSGERMTFINSVLDVNEKLFDFEYMNYDITLDNCSIDYNVVCFYSQLVTTNNNRKITVNNCHYETRNPNITTDETPHGILYGSLPQATIWFTNSKFSLNIKEKQFYNNGISGSTMIYFLNNNFDIQTGDFNTFTLNRLYQVPDNFRCIAKNNVLGVETMCLPFSTNQLINRVPGFTYIVASGNMTLNGDNQLIDSASRNTGLRLYSPTNISGYEVGSSYDNITTYKPLIIKNNTDDQKITFTLFENDRLPYNGNEVYYFNIACKNVEKITYIIEYFDKSNALITSETRVTLFENNDIEDQVLVIPHSYRYKPNLATRPNEAQWRITYSVTGIAGKDVEINGMPVYTA